VAVIAAVKLDDAVAAREAARQAHRAHHRLGAGIDQPQFADGRHRLADFFRQQNFRLGRRAEAQPFGRRLAHRVHHFGAGVAEYHRPPRADIINIAAPVGVKQPRAGGALDERRLAADRPESPHRRIDAAGYRGARPPVKFA